MYFLCAKYDVLIILPQFFSLIQTQFNTTIKTVRSDNALELSFTEFFKVKGVIPCHSCVDTPQQNSIVEYKHQHILNVACALLFESNMPLAY